MPELDEGLVQLRVMALSPFCSITPDGAGGSTVRTVTDIWHVAGMLLMSPR